MKLCLAATLALLIVSCTKPQVDSPAPATTTTTPEPNMKAIVVVFSATGITKGVA